MAKGVKVIAADAERQFGRTGVTGESAPVLPCSPHSTAAGLLASAEKRLGAIKRNARSTDVQRVTALETIAVHSLRGETAGHPRAAMSSGQPAR